MSYRFEKPKEKKEMPSGWRGIGCIFMIILPVISYMAAVFLLTEVDSIRSTFMRAMPGFFGTIPIHPLLLRVTALNLFWDWIRAQPDLPINLVLGIIILIALSGVIATLYGFMYRAVAPSKYGPTDAPPQKKSRGKRKRYTR